MKEEHVKFNRSTYMRAHCGALMLDDGQTPEQMKEELRRYAEMMKDNCKEGCLQTVIVNRKSATD